MSWWSRLVNAVRGERLSREIEEEFEAHIADAIEHGRDPEEARRAFGPALRQRERSRDLRVAAWLDSLRADAVFGWRQLMKKKPTSAAAILSLALAIGACASAFRLIDALLLRPLPVSEPERLYAISFEVPNAEGKRNDVYDSCSYPMFRVWRATAGKDAELIAVSYAERTDLTYGQDQDMEKAYLQYVSGWMFGSFGLRPAVGRLFTENDDRTPGAHPYAVLSYNYWTRRFGRDPMVIGRTLRMGHDLYQLIGVSGDGFTGTEAGSMTDIFVPTMMNAGSIDSANSFWFRTLVRLQPGAAREPLRTRMYAVYRAFGQERAKGFKNSPKRLLEPYPQEKMLLEPAAAGASGMQREYRRPLVILSLLVGLVLLIACANVANLMMAQAAARTTELALRVSIGAGRWRLVQLVLVESAWIGFLAAALGGLFTWWSAPLVAGMINPPDNPASLSLPADWRVLGFGVAVAVTVMCLFGAPPALRASRVKPVNVLRGAEDPHARRRLMHLLIAAQSAFCFVALFTGGLFVGSFERLVNRPTGFSAERLLVLDTVAQQEQAAVYWEQVGARLRATPGVEKVALANWPMLSGTMSNNFISFNGAPASNVLAFFLNVSPGWLETMKIPLISGRDLPASDANPGLAIVNRQFAKQYFDGANPIGKSFETAGAKGERTRYRIAGLAGDACYRNIRESTLSQVYVPFEPRSDATFLVRTASANPLAVAGSLRQEVTLAGHGFRVSNLRTQLEINQSQTVRERLLAILASFFAVVALVLAGVGLYGVLEYSVLQRRREIGIRMALGAQAGEIARCVTAEVFLMVGLGAAAGLALGMVFTRYIESLLYEVRATEVGMLVVPAMTILGAALLAALPGVIRAVRIDPVAMLRVE